MKEISIKECLRGSENITLLTFKRFTKENLGTAIWKDEELKYGMMGKNMKATLRMERKMEKELSNGQMVTNTLDLGGRVNSMDSAYGSVSKKEVLKDKVSGSMARGTNG